MLLLCVAPVAFAGVLDETRYAAEVVRNADGSIHRSAAVTAAFRRIHPCPSTMQMTGLCPDWQMNHEIPLACGGIDAVSNLYWASVHIKTCTQPWCIDRAERKIYARIPPVPGSSCFNEIIK